jgi:hypothetical protein
MAAIASKISDDAAEGGAATQVVALLVRRRPPSDRPIRPDENISRRPTFEPAAADFGEDLRQHDIGRRRCGEIGGADVAWRGNGHDKLGHQFAAGAICSLRPIGMLNVALPLATFRR